MSNFFTDAVNVVAPWVGGREDLAANIVSSAIWSVPTVLVTVAIYLFKRRARLSYRIYYLAALFKLTQRLKKRVCVDGFYFAIYDSSKSKSNGQGTRVAECIYLSTDQFSNRVTGYVFRRAKRKKGKIEENDYYLSPSIISTLRIVGRFSQNLHIFFGYWLDPYEPDTVAGTLRLKWFDKNIGVPANKRKAYLIGHWNGVDDDAPVPTDEKIQNYYGYADTGGEWRFHRIAIGISEFTTWRKQLDSAGDNPGEPTKFLDWSPK